MSMDDPEDSANSFLRGVIDLFEHFRSIHPEPDDLMVEITLSDSAKYYFRGIHADYAVGVPGCVMIRGQDSPPTEAIAVRVEDVARAVFYPPIPAPAGMGFPG